MSPDENSPIKTRPVTQKQIAERVGVTQQLVALALQDSSNVAALTKEKIIAVADELGHRKIAYLGPHLRWPSASERVEGYKRALQCAGIVIDDALIESTLSQPLEPDGKAGMTRLLERADFTALVCHNDPIAMGAIRAAQQAGRAVPADLSVTGFDDISLAAEFSPAITSVSFSSEAMGRAAVRLILDEPRGTGHKQFPVELHIRHSTAKGSD